MILHETFEIIKKNYLIVSIAVCLSVTISKKNIKISLKEFILKQNLIFYIFSHFK